MKHPKRLIITIAITLLMLSVALSIFGATISIINQYPEQLLIYCLFFLAGIFGCALAIVVLRNERNN